MSYWWSLVEEVTMVLISVLCPHCHSDHIMKGGTTKAGKQCYQCQNTDCPHDAFQHDLTYKGRSPDDGRPPRDASSTTGSALLPQASHGSKKGDLAPGTEATADMACAGLRGAG